MQRVVAGAAIDEVVAGIADQQVGEAIAGEIDVGIARQHRHLDVALDVDGIRQVDGDRRLHPVEAVRAGLVDDVADIVDDVGVVAGTALHEIGTGPAQKRVDARTALQRVVAGAAVDEVVATIADQQVGEAIAGEVDVGIARQHAHLDGAPEMDGIRHVDGDRRLHPVEAVRAGHALVDDVAGIVDDVGVVAGAAEHLVGARAAVEIVIANEWRGGFLVAVENIVAGAAIEMVVAVATAQLVVVAVSGDRVVEGRAADLCHPDQRIRADEMVSGIGVCSRSGRQVDVDRPAGVSVGHPDDSCPVAFDTVVTGPETDFEPTAERIGPTRIDIDGVVEIAAREDMKARDSIGPAEAVIDQKARGRVAAA